MNIADHLLVIACAHNERMMDLMQRAKTDPLVDALYRCWLLAADCSHDDDRREMDAVLTKIQDIAATALGIRP